MKVEACGTRGGGNEGGSLNGTRGGASEGGSLSGTRGSSGGTFSWVDSLVSDVFGGSSVTSNASKSFKPPSSEEIRAVFVEAADKCFGTHDEKDDNFYEVVTGESIMRFVVYQAELGNWYGRSCFLPDGMAKAFMDFVKSFLTSVPDDMKPGALAKVTIVLAKAANTQPLLVESNDFTFANALAKMLNNLLEDWKPLGSLTQKAVGKAYSDLFNIFPSQTKHYFEHPKRRSSYANALRALVNVEVVETVEKEKAAQEKVSKNVVVDTKVSNEKGAEQDATKNTEEDAEQDSKASPMKIPRMTPK